MQTLQKTEIEAALNELDQWSQDGNFIKRSFTFENFKEAFTFMSRVAFEAEELTHHPNWDNVYNKVNISLNTHDAGGITQKDIDLAARIDAIAKS
ncbi:4a-hydroxytetrahydrobiopterin dehydratase [Psychroflexus sp. ALD_RP9]|uniref:4a-hydroxytetrahydrobiopterin dehydratase n=1 Tax=Psychroflexus sp. ALD_RP9 TaxID=2777186 RepID=UPI001A8F1422|nr:4a-hydroxytetrahydrobiopterin dehydratase [Psychroflexus sp. ALD_RP9]QSS96722.1 4a-hydroxytetrahydrobiopterin dehydratase [Psychroflexus sp. ALD_RP9]